MRLPKIFTKKGFFSLCLIILTTLVLSLSFSYAVYATPQDDLAEIQRKLQEIRNKKSGIQNSINSEKKYQNQLNNEIYNLKNQIDLLNTQIQEKELIIQELELKIDILTKEIAVTEEEIVAAQAEIAKLQTETDKRLVDIYLNQKTYSQMNLIFSNVGTDFIKYDLYQNTIQQKTNDLLKQLKDKKEELNTKKTQLEEDKITVVKDETQLQEEKIAMEQDKTDLDQQTQVYYRKKSESIAKQGNNQEILNELTEEEQKTVALQTKIEQELFGQVKNLGSGTFVEKGTIIGRQGYSGYVIPKGPQGAHLHFGTKINGQSRNPCSLLPAGVVGGCGGSGEIDWPLRGSISYDSGYGWRSWSNSFHDAIDIGSPITHAYIYAAHSGWLYRGGNYNSGFWRKICEVKDDCSKGKYTFYLHLAE